MIDDLQTCGEASSHLMEDAPTGIFRVGTDGRCLYANRRWREMTGLAAARDLDWTEIVHPADRERVTGEWSAALAEKSSFCTRCRIQSPGQEPVRAYVRMDAELNDEGELNGYLGNITEDPCGTFGGGKIPTLSRLVETSSDFIGFTGLDGQPIFLNRAGRAMVGISESQFRHTAIFDYFPWDRREHIRNVVMPAALATGDWSGEYELRHFATGEAIPVHFSLFRLDDPATGEPVNFATITRDLSRLKETEFALRESERFTDSLAHNVPGLAYRCRNDRDWTNEFMSDGCLELTGHPASAFAGGQVKYADLIVEEDRQRVWDEVQEAVDRHRRFRLEYRIRTAAGKEKWVWEQGLGIFDENGALSHLEGFVTDISANRAAQAAQQRLLAIIDATPDFVAMADVEGNVQYLNRAGRELMGIAADEDVSALKIGDFHGKEVTRLLLEEGWPRAVAEGSWHNETPFLARDGREFITSQIILAHKNAAGEVEYFSTIARDITAQKRAEAALRESEALVRTVIENTREWIWAIDAEGRHTYCNPAIESILGYRPEELIGKTGLDLLHEEDRRSVADWLPRIVADKSGWSGRVLRWRHKDGGYRYLESNASPILDDAGEVVGFGGTDRDVTERMKIEQALTEFKTTLDLTLDSVFMFDPDSLRFTYLNEGALRQVGHTREELMAMTPVDIKPEYDEARFRAMLEPMLAGREAAHHFETPHRHRDGHDVPVEITLQYVKPEGGQPRFVAIVRDVSERKKAEAELERHRMHLEELVEERTERLKQQALIIDQIHDAVISTDLEGFVTGWNRGAENCYGYTSIEAVGRHVSFLYPAEEHEFLQQSVIAPLKARGWYRAEARVRRKSGEVFFVDLSLSMLHGADGEVSGMIGYAVDISERRQAQEALHDAQEELLRKERLATLGQLTATVSHELRNPLASMQTALYLLDKRLQGSDDRVRDGLGSLRDNIGRCDRIIDELLDFTRINKLNRRPLAIDEWLAGILDGQSVPDGIELRTDLSLPGMVIAFDPGRLRRAVINLFDNACQSMAGEDGAAGDGREAILTVTTRLAGGRAEIGFDDTGPGISPEVLAHVFEPLYSTRGFGVGLGLPAVRQIMGQHGGGVELTSLPGEGTRAVLWLPQRAAAEQDV